MPDWVAQTTRTHTKVCKPKPYTLPWETEDGAPTTVNLLFRWTDDNHIRARGYDELVWKPALAAVGVIPPPTKDKRGRRRYDTDRKTGITP
jgi:hypothetical protein